MKPILVTQEHKDTANFFLQAFVATSVVAMTGACLWVVSTFELDERNFSALQLFLGAALAWMGGLMSFCFPNSIGSQKDKDTISTLATAASAPMTTTTTVEQGAITPVEAKNANGQDGTFGVAKPTPGSGIQRGDSPDPSGSGTSGTPSSTAPANTTIVTPNNEPDDDYAPTETPR